MSELPGKIGRYEILGLVGRGAMGVVYRAKDPLIGRIVAIKMVASSAVLPLDSQAEFKERFFREAQTAGNLHHPNIVTIHDLGEEGGVPFMAQEFVEGESLSARLKRGALGADVALSIARQVAEGLAYAHERGVIHRDIKPDNILLDAKGRAVITDFGIARISTSELTRTGEVLGTPTFMSPEQVKGEELDVRSDLFSLGVVLYTMLSGQKPFKGDTISSVCYQVVHGDPKPPVGELSLPPALSRILQRLLAKDREARYASADEVVAELFASSDGTQYTGPLASQRIPASAEHDMTIPASGTVPPFRETPVPSTTVPSGGGSTPTAAVISPGAPKRSRRGWLAAAGVVLLLLIGLAGLLAAGRVLRNRRERAAALQPPAVTNPLELPPSAPPAPADGERAEKTTEKPPAGTARPAENKASQPKGLPAVPARESGTPLLFVAVGPLTLGQVQVTVDGKTAVHSPMTPATGPGGGEGFLVAERLLLVPGPHEFRFVAAAAKPGPFYAETSKQVTLEAGPEQVLVVRASRFPARLQVTGPMPRSGIPKELEAALSERPASGPSASGQALAGASEILRQEEPAGPLADRGQIQVLMDALLEEGELRLYLDGERVASRSLDQLPRPSNRPGFHFEGRVDAEPGAHTVRVVLDATRPRPFRAEGESSFVLKPGQRLRLRAEMERLPPRIRIVEVAR